MILGIGLAMVAAVFPAAMTYNQRSAKEVLGSIVCQNGASIARAVLRNGEFGNSMALASTSLGNLANYPSGDSDTTTGFMVLGRRMDTNGNGTYDENDYQMVIVAYRKADPAHTVSVVQVMPSTVENLEDGRGRITFPAGTTLQVGAHVIVISTGAYARIVAAEGAVAVVDNQQVPSGESVFVVVASAGAGGQTLRESPAIGVLVARTSLTAQ
jgi:hypothetical protein